MKWYALNLLICAVSFVFETSHAFETKLQGFNPVTNQYQIVSLAPKQKALAVIFLSTNCPSSDAHIPELKKLIKNYPEFQFVVLHSNQDETLAKSQKYFKALSLEIPVLEDQNATYANQLRAAKTPHVSLISPTGVVLYQGGITNSNDPVRADEFFLKDALDNIANSKSVKVPEGRTLGCLINRGEKNVW